MRQSAPVLVLLFCAAIAQAQEPRLKPPAHAPGLAGAPVTINADRIEGYANREASAIGNAELRQDDVSITADRLRYLYATDEVEASGGVRLERGGDRLSGTGLRLRVHDNVGQFDHAEYEFARPGRGGYAPVTTRGAASVIKLEGKDRYHLENATLTTCKPGNNDWYLEVGELDLDMTRDLGVARRGKLVFKGAPIAYVPWIDFPLHDQRKTGFLPPTIGSSGKSGVEISTPFYVNLAPNRDLTVTPRELSKRGLQLTTQFRYLDRNYDGDARLEEMSNDRVRNISRYAATFQHNQRFSSKLSGYLNLNKADTLAAAIAVALKAEKLFFLLKVPGLLADLKKPSSLVPFATLGKLTQLEQSGAVTAGMRPKLEAARQALAGGVASVHLVSGLAPDALLVEVFSNEGSGTMIAANEPAETLAVQPSEAAV